MIWMHLFIGNAIYNFRLISYYFEWDGKIILTEAQFWFKYTVFAWN